MYLPTPAIPDRFLLPQLQPEIPRNPAVVLVDTPVALSPLIELAGRYTQPMNEIARRRSRPSPTRAGRNSPLGPARHAAPNCRLEFCFGSQLATSVPSPRS